MGLGKPSPQTKGKPAGPSPTDPLEPMGPRPERFYHLTPAKNWESIQRGGLNPRRGPRSRKLGETGRATYLFPSKEEVETALENWAEEAFPRKTRLALVEITLPEGFCVTPTFPDPAGSWEWSTKHPIPPKHLRLIDTNL